MKVNFPIRYFVVAFIWAWLIESPLVLAGFGIILMKENLIHLLTIPVLIIAAFGPAVGTFYSLHTLNGKGSIKEYLKGLLDLQFGWKAWILPIIILGGSTCIAWILPELWGEPRLKMLLPSIWIFPLYLIIMIFLGGGQEELGWRGYILDPVEECLGPWLGNLFLGIIWGVWHLPLFFIPGTAQTFMNFWGFILQTTGYSWFFSWVRKSSGKRTMSGLVVHGFANAFIPVFPTFIMIKGASQTRFWIWECLTFIIGIITMLIYTIRIKRRPLPLGTVRAAYDIDHL